MLINCIGLEKQLLLPINSTPELTDITIIHQNIVALKQLKSKKLISNTATGNL